MSPTDIRLGLVAECEAKPGHDSVGSTRGNSFGMKELLKSKSKTWQILKLKRRNSGYVRHGCVSAVIKADMPLVQSDLLRLSRTNFSEAYQLLVHLKAVRVFIESVLRYGLPAEYSGVVVKVSFYRIQSQVPRED